MIENNNSVELQGGYDLKKHVSKTFLWMMLGLFASTVSAIFLIQSGIMNKIFTSEAGGYIPLVLFIGQVLLCIKLSASLMKMSVTTTRVLFLVFCFTAGFTLSVLALSYTEYSIGLAFLITAIYFGALAVIGMTTSLDLSRIRNVLIVSLLVLIVIEFVGVFFMDMSEYQMIISFFGVLIFTGFTAYDTQKMKKLFYQFEGDQATLNKMSVYSAFQLYLDFFNLFVFILRIMGKRR